MSMRTFAFGINCATEGYSNSVSTLAVQHKCNLRHYCTSGHVTGQIAFPVYVWAITRYKG